MTRARLVLPLVAVVAAPLPVRADEWVVRLSLDPAARRIEATMRTSVPPGAARHFALDRAYTLQSLSIDGRQADLRAERWLLPAGREIVVTWRGTAPSLVQARAAGRPGPFADPEGSFLPLLGRQAGDGALRYDITIDVPAGQRAIAPGRLAEEREVGGRQVARFVLDAPTDQLSVFAGPYRVGETLHRGLRLRTYFPAQAEPLGERYRSQLARYLDLFSAAIGPYPHDGFSVVASPLPVGLGFETLTWVGARILPLPFMQERSLAHEVLHAWWGHAVAVDYAHGNWAEALTTMMADYGLAEAAGEGAAQAMRRRWLADFAVLPPAQDTPLVDFVSKGHAASQVIGYGKGAMLFLMLRDEIGAPAFRDGLRRFFAARRFTVAGWDDLQAAFAAASQRPLDRFFRQWLQRSGAPRLALQDAARMPGGEVRFTLVQDEPAYALQVPVVIETAAGPERHSVRLDSRARTYTLQPASRATALRIDPEDRLFRKLSMGEVPPIVRSLVVAPDAVTAVADSDPAVAAAARAAATGLLEAGFRPSGLDEARAAKAPVLLVGTTASVAAALARARLPPRPSPLGEDGTARVWASRYAGDVPLLVVEGADASALRQAAGVIRHYGSSSWLVFEGGRVSGRGSWEPATQPLQVEFRD